MHDVCHLGAYPLRACKWLLLSCFRSVFAAVSEALDGVLRPRVLALTGAGLGTADPSPEMWGPW